MALSSSLGLRRLLRASPSSLPQWRWPFSPVRQSSSFPSDDDAAGGNLPPLTSPKLFAGGLSYDTNEAALKDAFCQHGEIMEVKVICDRITGKSKGYGFVQFCKESEATNAMRKMDGQLLDGRNIRVDYANKG